MKMEIGTILAIVFASDPVPCAIDMPVAAERRELARMSLTP